MQGIQRSMNQRDLRQTTQPRRGLSRSEAAVYIGVSTRKFEELVEDGQMPPPKRIGSRTVWDVRALDVAFDALPHDGETNPWD